MTQIRIPESLQFFYRSPENANAIEVLAAKTHTGARHLPQDASWNDLEAFHRAVLAAHQTQVDGWCFLRSVWLQVWAPAISKANFSHPCTEYLPNEYERAERSIDAVWNDGFYVSYHLAGGHLVTGCWLTENALQIVFYFEDSAGTYSTSNHLALDIDIWELDEPEDQFNSKSERASLGERRDLDLGTLAAAADEAMIALVQALKSSK